MFVLFLEGLVVAWAGVTLFGLFSLAYNLLLHPLRSFPGPWYAKCNFLWSAYRLLQGDHWHAVHELHLKYGPVVRIAPDELSFVEARAWKDIYGYRAGSSEFPKHPSQTFTDTPDHPHIVIAPREKHSKLRKLISHGFSDKALREQEPILTKYVMKMIEELKRHASSPVNLVSWYNFTTFDVIGELVYSESFDCLSSSTYHPWVSMIFSTLKWVTWTRVLSRLAPGCVDLLLGVIPKRVSTERKDTANLAYEKLLRRKEKTVEYTDFSTNLLAAEEKGIIDAGDLMANLPILILAGSETTATALSGMTYYLLQNPKVYARLVKEIRSNFQEHSDVTMPRLSELKYLPAVIEEGLRMYPPANSNHPRVLPPQGATVCGRYVPGGTLVGIPHYASFNSPHNFADPERFVPERHLGEDERYALDKRDAIQPFHVGPRNCIGRNLAYIEMRLILAHLFIEFDLELQPESIGWEKQDVYSVWDKKPLMVRLLPRSVAAS